MRQSRKAILRHHGSRSKTPPSLKRRSKKITVTREREVRAESASPPPLPPPQIASYVADQPRRPTIMTVNMHNDESARPAIAIRPSTSGKTFATIASDTTEAKPDIALIPGPQFKEDPRWRKTFDPPRPRTADTLKSIPIIDAWANPHAANRLSSHQSVHPQLQDITNSTSGPLISDPTHGARLRGLSDANSVTPRHPICGVPSARTLTFGLSEHTLRHPTALKRWLSRSLHHKHADDDAAPSPVVPTRRTGIPRPLQRLTSRQLHSQKKTTNRQTVDVISTDTVVDLDHLDESELPPAPPSSIMNPLHDPEADRRFSVGWKEDWAGKLEDQMNRIDGEEALFDTNTTNPKATQSPHLEARPATSGRESSCDASLTQATRHEDTTETTMNVHRDNETAPRITITSVQSTQYPTPPRPGPRTSSKVGARLGHMMRSTFSVDSCEGASPSLPDSTSPKSPTPFERHPRQTSHALLTGGLEVQRTLSRASSRATLMGASPSKSVDTLSRIEAQVQTAHPAGIGSDDTSSPRSRMSAQWNKGPSGEPPERPLPDLPESHQQILADDGRSSRASSSRSRSRRHSRQPRSGPSHKRQGASVSSTTNPVRAISPIIGASRSHSISSKRTVIHDPGSPQNASNLRLDLSKPTSTFPPQNVGTSVDLRSPTSIYSAGSSISSSQSVTFKTTTTIHSARVDHVKAIRKRDLTAYAAHRRIEEEAEGEEAADPIDHFPSVATSRPSSRTQSHPSRQTSCTHRRNSAATRRSNTPSTASHLQPLSQSGIMIIADTDPVTSTFRAGAMSPTSRTTIDASSGRRQASMHELNAKFAQNKKPQADRSIQSIRSHHPNGSTSHPIVTKSGAPQTPPSSSGSEGGDSVTSEDDPTPVAAAASSTLQIGSRREAADHNHSRRLNDIEETLRHVLQQLERLTRTSTRSEVTRPPTRWKSSSSFSAVPAPVRMTRNQPRQEDRLSAISSSNTETSSGTLDGGDLPPLVTFGVAHDRDQASQDKMMWTGTEEGQRFGDIVKSTRVIDCMLRRGFDFEADKRTGMRRKVGAER